MAKSPLKWCGGKRQLLPELIKRIPNSFISYHEPFCGGASLFFDIHDKTNFAFLSDLNPELINFYKVIQETEFSELEAWCAPLDETLNKQSYDFIRALDRQPNWPNNISDKDRAARFLFLNKTGFNGLYRVNKKGQFNVPFGRNNIKQLITKERLLEIKQILSNNRFHFIYSDFSASTKNMLSGDFVYIDPPYIPLSVTSDFTSYTQEGFGLQEQIYLREYCELLDNKAISWMQSNSSSPMVYELYKKFNIEEVDASRMINSNGSGRGKVKEVIIRNYT